MKKVRFFDTLCLFAILSLLFSVGFHIGKNEEDTARGTVLVSVSLQKMKLGDSIDELLVDGRYECETVSLENNVLTIRCEGMKTDAGFLFSGAKYISKNQPLEILGGGSYFYGRIKSITPEDLNAL